MRLLKELLADTRVPVEVVLAAVAEVTGGEAPPKARQALEAFRLNPPEDVVRDYCSPRATWRVPEQ